MTKAPRQSRPEPHGRARQMQMWRQEAHRRSNSLRQLDVVQVLRFVHFEVATSGTIALEFQVSRRVARKWLGIWEKQGYVFRLGTERQRGSETIHWTLTAKGYWRAGLLFRWQREGKPHPNRNWQPWASMLRRWWAEGTLGRDPRTGRYIKVDTAQTSAS